MQRQHTVSFLQLNKAFAKENQKSLSKQISQSHVCSGFFITASLLTTQTGADENMRNTNSMLQKNISRSFDLCALL